MASVFVLQINDVNASYVHTENWTSGQYMYLHNRFNAGYVGGDWPMGRDSLHEATLFPNFASAQRAYDTYKLHKIGTFKIVRLDEAVS